MSYVEDMHVAGRAQPFESRERSLPRSKQTEKVKGSRIMRGLERGDFEML